MSAPKSPAISTITVAAPGNVPQAAVVPGSTRKRVSSQPIVAAAKSTAAIATRNSGQRRANSVKSAGVNVRAIIAPISACAAMKAGCGTANRAADHRERNGGGDRAEQQRSGDMQRGERAGKQRRAEDQCRPAQPERARGKARSSFNHLRAGPPHWSARARGAAGYGGTPSRAARSRRRRSRPRR